MFAYGSSTLILALYFSALGHSDAKIGLFMTLTLIGDVLISLALTFVADALGRRRILILGAGLMVLSGLVFATTSNYWILLFAAVVGVISPSGNEIGPFRAIEESTLAHLSEAKTRSDVFAWYVVVGTLGAAGGSLVCGWTTQGLQHAGWSEVAAFRFVFWIYALLGGVKAGVSMLLSSRCEMLPESKDPVPKRDNAPENQPFLRGQEQSAVGNGSTASSIPTKKSRFTFAQISQKSRTVLAKLCALFFLDSLPSGMVPVSLIAFYLERKFGMPDGQLGTIVSTAQFMSSIGNIFASSVAKKVGLVRAMVFTHLPSSIALALIPAPSSLLITVVLFVFRAGLSSMDQAPRSAFLSAVVLPEERTAVMGIVNTVKTMSQSSGPLITGYLAGGQRFWVAFIIAGALKASYDVGLLIMFGSVQLEGDRRAASSAADDSNTDQFELDSEPDSSTELDDLEPPTTAK